MSDSESVYSWPPLRSAFRHRTVVDPLACGKTGQRPQRSSRRDRLNLPWWIYHPAPALMTVLLASIVFRMGARKTLAYLLASAASAPLIHSVFSFLLASDEYMPFLRVPSLASLLA
jgi:hypothetical protein